MGHRVLHEIARHGHSRLSCAEVWGTLDFTDEDPDDPGNVILLYTSRSHPKPGKVGSTLNPNHDNDLWNREHVWPKSHGFPSEGQLAHTDIHHHRPTDVTCNSDRGDLDFDGATRRIPSVPPDAMPTASSRAIRSRAMWRICCSTWTSATPAPTASPTSS